MNFGTGAVKITPAHDPNDFLCGQRHNLEQINIFSDDGCINANGGPFAGMRRFDARVAVEKEMDRLGLLRGKEDNKMRLGLCSRSGDVIEPVLKPQVGGRGGGPLSGRRGRKWKWDRLLVTAPHCIPPHRT